MAHPNEDLLRRGYEAFAAGDIETVLAIFADDIAWHIPGESQLSGDFHGHQEVLDFFGRLLGLTDGTFRLDVEQILANDTHGVVLVTAYAARDNRELVMPEVHVWRLADGKATEHRSFFWDDAVTDGFFG
ncbi:MAG TPA: nuclear transport factor 2 family protein [Streptosporangiaceae bacterium]|nr:nuclear transport factor 2 family protein [Streptosporangiaceae bacterium]